MPQHKETCLSLIKPNKSQFQFYADPPPPSCLQHPLTYCGATPDTSCKGLLWNIKDIQNIPVAHTAWALDIFRVQRGTDRHRCTGIWGMGAPLTPLWVSHSAQTSCPGLCTRYLAALGALNLHCPWVLLCTLLVLRHLP